MKESTLLKISLISAIVGVIALYFISQTIKIPSSSLLEEDNTYDVQGSVARITEKEKVTYIDLQKEDELTVILFKRYPVDLHKGDYIEVTGKASKSDTGELQLIGNEVRVVK